MTKQLHRVNRKVVIDLARKGCIIWPGRKSEKGYGRAYDKDIKNDTTAHRVVYKQLIGPIPAGYHIDHVKKLHCRGFGCVQPKHLEAVTPKENARRSPAWSTNPYLVCRHGHDMTRTDAWYITHRRNGVISRRCRLCHQAEQQARRHQPRSEQ